MVLSQTEEERKKFSRGLKEDTDKRFLWTSKSNARKPVTIRLLDAPLHEFCLTMKLKKSI